MRFGIGPGSIEQIELEIASHEEFAGGGEVGGGDLGRDGGWPAIGARLGSGHQQADLLGDGGQMLFGLGAAEGGERLGVLGAALQGAQPVHSLEVDGVEDDGEDAQSALFPLLDEVGDFAGQDEIGGEEAGGDEQHGDAGAVHGLLDLLLPGVAAGDLSVAPGERIPWRWRTPSCWTRRSFQGSSWWL